MGLLASKGLDSTLICFCGMDGTNAVSGQRKGLQCRILHTSPHSVYINCNNHWLALSQAHDTKVSHTCRIGRNASSVSLEIVPV